ncbi:hypothetical protein VNO77_03966 [Canavalia gladiata]|uniref:Uncharacterized protein n=1 Tax=Canavalia gladiata TaxID=3824 RepID=A0AAN9R7B5_CANGL
MPSLCQCSHTRPCSIALGDSRPNLEAGRCSMLSTPGLGAFHFLQEMVIAINNVSDKNSIRGALAFWEYSTHYGDSVEEYRSNLKA